MRIMRDGKYFGERQLDTFLSLPRRAQQLFFEYMEEHAMIQDANPYTMFTVMDWSCDGCDSPIEKIFKFSYELYTHCYVDVAPWRYGLIQQYEIECEKNIYRADFVFSTIENSMEDNDYSVDFLLAIECDGHDFHEKTKEQVRRNNERDYALKKCGYDVLHFSGSQIYAEPLKCAKDVFDYIQGKIGDK